MFKFRINELDLNVLGGTQKLIPKSINVLVGPNNSGKSRLLKELRDYMAGDNKDIKMINSVDCPFPTSFSELDEAYAVEKKMQRDRNGNWMLKMYSNKPPQAFDLAISLENYYTRGVSFFDSSWKSQFENAIERKDIRVFFEWLGALFFQYIGTEERLTICKTQANYGFDTNSTNYLSSFKFQGELLNELSIKIKELFGKDIYLDYQTMGNRIAFRVGTDLSYVKNRSIDTLELAMRLRDEQLLDDQGDGLKSFVSTFLSLKLERGDILLLDEPEAFLHPPLARQLGEMIGETQSENRTVFIATHSVEILKGILSKSQDVNVVRITQPEPGKNEINVLDQKVLNAILENPFLRVSRVLEGIFCEKVILTEAEADELVYQELIEKVFPESGMYFAHGQNKQTLPMIAQMYQKIGINYEIIADFDVLRVSSEFNEFLELMPFDERWRQKLLNYADKLREKVGRDVETAGLSEKEVEHALKNKRDEVYHRKGIRFFNEEIQRKIRDTFLQLSEQRVHIVETGELETILEDYGVPYNSEKNKWIIDAINRIAAMSREDVSHESYLYQFLHGIVKD